MQATPKALALALASLGLALLALRGASPGLTAAAGAALLVLLAYMAGVAVEVEGALAQVEASREPRLAKVVEGEEVRVRLRISNPTRLTVYSLVAREEADERLAPASPGVFGGSLPGGSVLEASYTIKPPPGLSRVNSVLLEAGDPLGLYRSRRRIWVTTSIQAYPRPYPPPSAPGERQGLAEALRAARRGWGFEFYSLRDYVPGDDIRLVAWLPSARAGRPVVRENVEERILDACVFLDLSLESWAGPPGESAAEWIMRAALGVVEALASSGGWACYRAFLGEASLRAGPERARDLLEWMAEQLSSISPGHARRRLMLSRAAREFDEETPTGAVALYLIGPGAAERVLEALRGSPRRWRAVVVEALPMGGDRLSQALARAFEAVDTRYIRSLSTLGVPAYIAGSPPALAAAIREGVLEVARRGPLLH
ncbi:MAG: DUF58 domain-containing protein [Desulfurococcales archaeon]|nr:DUF58 domain-containing protein [Desulfurococcales archaeon]